MKKIYTLFSILALGTQLNAQLTLTQAANEPIIGNTWNIRDYDSTGVVPKNTGTAQVWNFNAVMTANTFTETTTYLNPASTPSASSFPASNIASTRGGTGVDYYKTSTNNLEMLGFVDGGSGNKVVFGNPAIWYPWPISFGSVSNGTFTAVETGVSTNANWVGAVSYSACGTGTVIMPGGNTHTNCLLYRRYININISGSYTATMSMVQYEFFSSSRKMPIIKLEYFKMTSGSGSTNDFTAMVDMNALSVGVNELANYSNQFNAFPNPTTGLVNVILANNAIAENLEVVDVNGRIVLSANLTNTIDVSNLQKGVYYIRISNKEFVMQKPIVLVD
ncbi:MAG: T9SS type A sorting domain-containing protein [Bacteroidia bacterium]|nr:T9SS type A sorting domain-containing protein [Bacteroidia bacterium]